jgi:hypothetical protein
MVQWWTTCIKLLMKTLFVPKMCLKVQFFRIWHAASVHNLLPFFLLIYSDLLQVWRDIKVIAGFRNSTSTKKMKYSQLLKMMPSLPDRKKLFQVVVHNCCQLLC